MLSRVGGTGLRVRPRIRISKLAVASRHTHGSAAGIDNAGNMVGQSSDDAFNDDQAVIWVEDQPYSLNDIVGEAADGGNLFTATDIAENGWVVGLGEYQGYLSLPWRTRLSFGPNVFHWADPTGGLFFNGDNWEEGDLAGGGRPGGL